jgi:hypothetical protein
LALFAVAIVPWYLRQLAVFGTLSPSTASGKVLFIRDIGEWNSISIPASLDHLLGMGWGPLLMTRAGGLVAALFIFSVLVGALVLIPFLLVGAWKRRRDAAFGPYFAYALLLFAFSAMVSAVHVPGGTFIHSAVALAPHGYVLALLGVVASVRWIAARRERWDAERASRVFVAGAVAFGILAAAWGSATVHASWDEKRQRFLALNEAMAFARVDPADRVMSIDASGTKYWTGRGGVVLVNDPIETVEAVARAYDIRWLVLEPSDTVLAAAAVMAGERPAWLGYPVVETQQLSLFPVCTTPEDDRCEAGA